MIQAINLLTRRYGTVIPQDIHPKTERNAGVYVRNGGALFKHPALAHIKVRISQPMVTWLTQPEVSRLHKPSIFAGIVLQSAVDNALIFAVVLGISYLAATKGSTAAVQFISAHMGIIYGMVSCVGLFASLASVKMLSAPLPVLLMDNPKLDP